MENIEVGPSTVTTPEELFAKMDMIIDGLNLWNDNGPEDDEMLEILIHRTVELHSDFDVLDENNPVHMQTAGEKVQLIHTTIQNVKSRNNIVAE